MNDTSLCGYEEALLLVGAEVLGDERFDAPAFPGVVRRDSLTAFQFLAGVRRRCGVALSLGQLLEAPSLNALAETLVSCPPLPATVEAETPERESWPLSDAQRRVWDRLRKRAGQPANAYSARIRLCGELDIAVLEQALRAVVAAQPVLQVVFEGDGDTARQRLGPQAPVELESRDLREAAVEEARERAELLAEEAWLRPFDLERGPLLRAQLVSMGAREWLLFLNVHGLVADACSFSILVGELGRHYRAIRGGKSLEDPSEPWAAECLAEQAWDVDEAEAARCLAVMRARFDREPPLPRLPLDRPRPAALRFRALSEPLQAPASLVQALRRQGDQQGATLFMTLLTGLFGLLARYSGETDLTAGALAANRARRRRGKMAGLFGNQLAIRVDLRGEPTVAEAIARTRAAAVEAYDCQALPYERLKADLAARWGGAARPLFSAMLIWEASGACPADWDGVQARRLNGLWNTPPCELAFVVREEEDGSLGGRLVYDADIYDADTTRRLRDHWLQLISGLAREASAPLHGIPLLTSAERRRIASLLQGRQSFPKARCVHETFEAQARIAPERTALSLAGESVAYAELNARANRLARWFRARGAGPETIVALMLPRSIDLIAAMLAALKAGAAYAPLETSGAPQRVRFILADSDAALLATNTEQAAAVGDARPRGCELALLDEAEQVIADFSPENPPVAARADNLAYAIYTSGSTGRPKGALIPHRNATRLFEAARASFNFGQGDVWTMFHSPAFDFSVWEIWGALLHGGRLAIAPYETTRSPEAFYRLLREEKATVLNQTPSAFMQLDRYEATLAEKPALDLRLVIFGGEALDCASLAGWFDRHGEERPRLVNMYGITETTVHVTERVVRRADLERPMGSAIGRPLSDLSTYALDPWLQPAPLGAPGELYVGGDALARGYHRQPALTAERFIPNPFAERPGERLYRSGDLARVTPQAELVYLGRVDRQVKIRGHRIELGEVERVLTAHPGVREAVAAARPDRSGRLALNAYLVAGEEPPALPELRRWLAERLPDYMTPVHFVWMKRFPLTVNGKLDREALPEPEAEAISELVDWIPPETETETRLIEIWREVLGVSRIGAGGRFFDLGGDSLTAVELVYRLRSSFEVDAPFSLPFTAADLREMAARIDAMGVADKTAPSLSPDPANRFQPFELNEIQQAYYLGRSGAFELGNVACRLYLAFDAAPGLGLAELERAFQKVIDRHDMLRAIVRPDGRQQVLAETPPYRLQVIDLAGLAREADDAALRLRAEMSHELTPAHEWPLFRIRALRLDRDRVRLLLSFDLLILDGFSLLTVIREWQAWVEQPQWRPEPLGCSFRDAVLAEAAWRETPAWRKARAYWRARLADLPSAPALPLAKSPAAVSRPRFARVAGVLGAGPWSRLKARARDAGLTPSAALCAAYIDALGHWSRHPRFLLNITLFNRRPLHPDIQDVVGDFTTLSLLDADADAAMDFRSRAQTVQEQLWRDLDRRDYSGIQVMGDLSASHRLGTMARAPVVFTSLMNDFSAWDWLGELVYSISQTPQVWLDHVVMERRGELVFHWDYVEGLFPEGMIADMFGAYCAWLEQLADDGAVWTVASPSLTPAAHRTLQRRVNQTEAATPGGLLHQPIEAVARRSPHRAALISANERLTYGELDAISNRLAWTLRYYGVKPNDPVAVLMEKGWEQAAAALGVLKAGAAFVPIDADLPVERVSLLLQDSRLALTQPWVDNRFDLPEALTVVHVSKQCQQEWDEQPLEPIQTPADLAYVIYTSGSTGRPKGVMINHLGPLNTNADINSRFGVGEADRVLALSAFNFDLSIYDLFGVLAVGGAVVLPDHERIRDPSHWLALMEAHAVTIWNTVPALMQMLTEHLAAAGGAMPASLRLALLSGDWLPVDLPDRMRGLKPDLEVVSLGGATEASIWSILYPIDRVDPAWNSVPYGKPMVNQRFHVLDNRLRPRPTWAPGELYIGGVGVALGYWRDPERTNAAFVSHPQTGERLYRTGDIGRWLPDGNIEFMGRDDGQVKVRGYRIELGEIEAHLRAHQRVSQALATVWGDSDQDKKLVAYVTPKTEPDGAPSRRGKRDQGQLMALKLSQPGLRADLEDAPRLDLQDAFDSDDVRAFLRRRSVRRYLGEAVPLNRLAGLLSTLRQTRFPNYPLPKRRYGSAGGLYPVQAYVYLKPGRVDDAPSGLYYFSPDRPALRFVGGGASIESAFVDEEDRALFEGAAFALFLVAKLDAMRPIYGEDTERYCLLEAGAICQLLETAAPELALGLCQVGGVAFETARHEFNLEADCQYLHCLIGGAVAPSCYETLEPTETPVADEERPEELAVCLRESLRRNLPEYMIPVSFNLIDAFPLTANGKIDRKALPSPNLAQSGDAAGFAAPTSALQETIARVFQEALGVSRVSADAHFFDVGGNSLRLVQAHGRLQVELGRPISIIEMFRRPSVKALAAHLGEKHHEDYVKKSAGRAETRRQLMAARRRKGRKMRVKA